MSPITGKKTVLSITSDQVVHMLFQADHRAAETIINLIGSTTN